MVIQDQSEVLRFLSHPSTYLAPDSPVERIDTHGAAVFLTGERAYKLKKAVCYDFLDFSSEPLRRRACEAEVRVNRRTAPNLYLETQPITREAGGTLALGGHGLPVDWVVVMRRFPQEALLDRLAARKRSS